MTKKNTIPQRRPAAKQPAPRAAGAKPVRRRLPPQERELLIVESAISYFAEVGFSGQTRELAKRMGITNALLFRYFPTKEALIDRVYQHVYLGRWRPEWEHLLKDRGKPLEQRLRAFYRGYVSALTYEWVRIFFFSGLRGVGINERYLALLEQRVIRPICREVRHEFGLPDAPAVPISADELDAAWGLQGQILYISIRRHIYNQPIEDPERVVDAAVDVFINGMAGLARRGALRDPQPGAAAALT